MANTISADITIGTQIRIQAFNPFNFSSEVFQSPSYYHILGPALGIKSCALILIAMTNVNYVV